MAMFESLQIQNGLAGSLYGGQNPTGIFSYTRKRPVENQQVIWGDYKSRANFGLGLDSSMKFEKFGYRAVFYGSDGAKQVKGSNYQRRLASAVFELYPTDALTLQAAASYYEHNTHGFAGLFALYVKDGHIRDDLRLPDPVDNKTPRLGQKYGGMNLKTTTLSTKFNYMPSDIWYFEGGFAWQRVDRDTYRITGDVAQLNPYRSKQYEIGAKARVGELDVSSALFRIERPIAYADKNDNYAEHGKQINQWLEVMAGGKPIENLSVFGGVTLISPKFKNPKLAAADGKVVPSVSKINSNLLFDYVVPNTNKLAFSANFHYSSGMYIDDVNSQKTPSYFTTDLGVRYTSKAWLGKQTTIRFNVNNVFNEKYWAGMNPAGMDGNGSTTGVNSIQGLSLGESRMFMLSAEVKF